MNLLHPKLSSIGNRIKVFTLLALFISCNTSPKNEKLTIATAANMQFAMKELMTAFTDKTGVPCQMVTGSSGKLTAQIKEGAPYHVFVSADFNYASELHKTGYTTGTPKTYAYGKLVLWSMVDHIFPSIVVLNTEDISHIALANPNIAPYGKAAIETLKTYNIDASLKEKFVYGESISQTNQFIITQAADIGFTSLSVVLSPQMKEKGKWILVDETTYSPIEQSIVLLKNEESVASKAQQFQNFLFSKEARTILEHFGYAFTN